MSPQHDSVVHHPKGGASYYFQDSLIRYLNSQCTGSRIILHIGTQPNSSPHIGNITAFANAFALASALKSDHSRDVELKLIYVDSAPAVGKDIKVNGIRYQRSLKHTGDFQKNEAVFSDVLSRLSALSEVQCKVNTVSYWRASMHFKAVLQNIIAQCETLGPHLSPKTGKLAIRAACPHSSCGLADKHGINNLYHAKDRISFLCPDHGRYDVDLTSQDIDRIEFNTPLRNLIRVLICTQDKDTSWIMCTGADYAGFYQEQLLWRLLDQPAKAPIIFYNPLITDWSGSKLSKSLYVEDGAYKYLRGTSLEYMLDGSKLLKAKGGLDALFAVAQEWVKEPYKLFRNYSIECLHEQLMEHGMHPC
jgi:hypothetical protein